MYEKYRGKKIAVLGFGLEGQETFKFLVKRGFSPAIIDKRERNAIASDISLKDCEFYTGDNYLSAVSGFDVVYKTPGIKYTEEILEAQKKGVIITTQIEEFLDICPGRIIGVTGTKGKGTTSTLVFEMLKQAGEKVFLGGNIGTPALSFVDDVTPDSFVVLELSSFQLQNLQKSPNISVVLNITQEHLDYHSDVNEYRQAKSNIVRFQKKEDMAVFNADYEVPVSFSKLTPAKKFFVSKEKTTNGCYVNSKDEIILAETGEVITTTDNLLLRGRHNLENVTSAAQAAFLAGVNVVVIKEVLESFRGLEHRLELVREVDGVRYYNDSFSTVPETAIAAIKSFTEPKILILGGSYKGSDYRELGRVIAAENIKAIILIGEMAASIDKEIPASFKGEIIYNMENMKDIVNKCHEIAAKGDVVLLSPACASFGLFKNYKDRGNQFREVVRAL